jgi:hypothetical protein
LKKLGRTWDAYNKLPEQVRERADKAFALLKSDPGHPSLRLKKIGDVWSARVDRNHRALAIAVEGGLFWFWIGDHADYEKLL